MRVDTIDYVTISIQAFLVIAYVCGKISLDLLAKASLMFWGGYLISMCVSRSLSRLR